MGQMPDEDGIAATVIGDLLTSTLMAAYERKPASRVQLYCWEREGLQWLIRFKARRPRSPINGWIARFIDVNEAAITDPNGTISFNLRDAG